MRIREEISGYSVLNSTLGYHFFLFLRLRRFKLLAILINHSFVGKLNTVFSSEAQSCHEHHAIA